MRNGISPAILQEGILDVLSNSECRRKIKEEIPDTSLTIVETMICAQRDGVDACKGLLWQTTYLKV